MPASEQPAPSVDFLLSENHRLKRAVEELSILNDLARAIGASYDLQDILHTIVRRSLKALHAEQGVITLVDEQPDTPMRTLVRTMVSSSDRQPFELHQSLLGWMHINKTALIINDPDADEHFRGVQWDESINSLLCVPLIVKSELRGMLTIYNKKGFEDFSADDERVLTIIAAQSAQVIENARLYVQEQALVRMQEEMRLAYNIQINLLPKGPPKAPGYDIAGKSIPAQNVGGDFYNFIRVDTPRLAVCLGDISGKGISAALLMANLQATIRGQTHMEASATSCIQRANTLLYQSTGPSKFATAFYGILDVDQHQFSYCNAGHNPPFLYTDGDGPLSLQTGGVVLGFLEEAEFDESTVPLQPGDLLVIYSDGITEAMNAGEEEFEEERLQSIIREHRDAPSDTIIEKIIEAVEMHADGAPQADDMTLVVIRRNV
jgi:phosphoserine phosphatase RsbU/P